MNFFQKLTGSLRMPAEEEIFPEESPSEAEKKSSATTPPSPQVEETGVKTATFKQMLADEEDTDSSSDVGVGYNNESDGGDGPVANEEEPEDIQTNLATAQLASARTASKRRPNSSSNPIKRGLISLRLKKDGANEADVNAPEGQLAIDVYETPEEIVIKSTIAGVKSEDLDVGIEDNTVNIRGSRHNEEKIKGEDYFYQECYWGTFSRSVILPVEVDSDKTQASLKDGILTVRLPKIIKEKEKKIKILS